MRLPSTQEVMETLVAKQEAKDTVSGMIERNLELEQIFETLQPLLFALSVKLYGPGPAETISLDKLINDGVAYLNPNIIDGELK